MKIASAEALARLLAERLAASGEPGRAVTVAQLVERILPYPLVRERLGLAGKAEYDLAVLRLLTDRVLLQLDPALHEAATKELEQPEPDLRPLEKLSESLLRVRDPARATRSREAETDRDEAGADAEPRPGSETSGPGTARASSIAESPSGMVPEPAAEPHSAFVSEPESAFVSEPESDAVAEPESDVVAEPPSDPVAESAPESAGGTGPAPPAGSAAKTERESVAELPPEPGPRQEEPPDGEPAPSHPAASLPEPSPIGPSHAEPSARTTDRAPAEPRATEAPRGVACCSCVAPLPIREGVRFCPHCGVDQQAARCTSCGDRLEPGWFFCPRCGRALDRP